MLVDMTSLRSGGFLDPGWEHGIAQDEKKKKVRCNYCGKVVSGGIYRLKQHLARVSGEVTYCEKAPDEVYHKMRENLQGCRFNKKLRQMEYEEQSYLNFHGNGDIEEEDPIGYKNKGKNVVSDKGLVINMAPLRSLGYVDPGWEHGIPQDDRKKKVKCNYCDKIVSGGINRFKQHLARIPGEVAPCKSAPEEVYFKIKENMKWHRTGRRHRQADTKEISALYIDSDDEEEEEAAAPAHHMSTEKTSVREKRLCSDVRLAVKGMFSATSSDVLSKRPRFDAATLKTPKNQTQSSSKQLACASKRSRKDVVSAISKFFHHIGIPAHAANSPYFHKMLEVVGHYGPDLVCPSSRVLSGRFLQDEIITIKNYLAEYRASWAVTGCSILADSWQDTQGKTLINILVSCPRGMHFVCSIDASNVVDDATYLFKLLDKVVEDMGEENVIQVITQNTPTYEAAGRMLEEKRRNLFWAPCASHCIDQMLEDFTKIKWVGECLEKAQKITKFIYNRMWLLGLMKREFTGGQELLRPSVTKYASSFSTLQSLLDHRVGLKKMFQSNKWHSSRYSKLDDGKEVEKIVLSASFWKRVQYVKKSVEPVVDVLLKVNGDDRLSIPFIYNCLFRAKRGIKENHGDDVRKYSPFLNVIDSHWNILSHHPLYLAAYFLNPAYHYCADFVPHPDVMRGLTACIVRLEPDNTRRISASMQISDFDSAKADFGTDLAISTRMELDPAAWWQQHGINCLELQRIAVRILSQTCSSFGCERSWSMFDKMYHRRHNTIAQRRLNGIIYVHYNLRLRERQIRKRTSDSISLEGILDESLLYDWIVEAEKQAVLEDEEILSSDMEHVETHENELSYDVGSTEFRKGSLEMATLADIVDPSDFTPANNFAGSDDEAEMDFIGDNLSD